MLLAALKAAGPAVRPALRPATAFRSLSTTLRVASGHGPKAPSLFGPGGKVGEVPTDLEQATGLERFELLGEMEGIDVFDETPLDSSRVGTKKNPIMVLSNDPLRVIGCTGSPADSHDIIWLNLTKERQRFCTECGSVYQLDYQGEEEEAHHH
ncbi:hypothetical protein MIND_00237900 [Mycena indigotica]|uniref:Cytochrome c oxidase subunit 4, mitochondrial n=1 Tax=Mycena indigotica TaxID=2126181 RepID=A0A8H6WH92_9AGAR|nr:uncharacterized protein MIND_00237900 [Mycena indigotica]KAF7312249.1 hypothetical protein MIND_00237900 [Mycena indigotica]